MAHFGGGITAVKDRRVGKGYRFGTLKRSFAEYYDLVYFDMAGFEGGAAALKCALLGIRLNDWCLPATIRTTSLASARTPAKG